MEANDDGSKQHNRRASLESGLPSKQIEGSQGRRRSVSFRPDIDARVVPSLSELPKNKLWYNFKEYQRFSRGIKSTIETLSRNNSIDEDEHCTRGLEFLTEEGASRRREKQRTMMNAVLDKQIDIWAKGTPKPEEIAEAYRFHSVHSVQDALTRALEDEHEAKARLSL
jgi:hypothetical protein